MDNKYVFNEIEAPNVKIFKEYTQKMAEVYQRKNHDYGDSFQKQYDEFGLIAPVIRLNDKLGRLSSFVKNHDLKVSDESIDDTLLDLANYAVMTLVARRIQENNVSC